MSKHPIPAAALERHIAILGKTGSGKSNAAKTIAERLLSAGERVCVIDPTGTWWGMRIDAGGKKPSGLEPVIFGGNHADIQISAEHGGAIAEAIGTSSTSAIIDTRLMTVGARTRFFSAFGEALLRSNKGALHLIIDEAHLFAPQGRVNDPASGAMLHAANNLVSLGRGIGLRIIMISQRPAKLHKDSLTQVETLVAMRLIAPQDRKAIGEWVGEWADPAQGKEIISGLPSLSTGDAWVWSPEIEMLERVHFPLASTFDSGRPTAEGEVSLKPIDVNAMTERLGSIKEDAIANDPARLKRRIAELEKKGGGSKADLEAARREGYQRGWDERGAASDKELQAKFDEGFSLALAEAARAVQGVARPETKAQATAKRRTVPAKAEKPKQHGYAEARLAPASEAQIPSGAEALVRAAAQHYPALFTWGQLAALTGRKARGGHFNTCKRAILDAKVVTERDGKVVPDMDWAKERFGIEAPDASTPDEIRAAWLEALPNPAGKMLRTLIEFYDAALSAPELGEQLDMAPRGGHWNTGMRMLRDNALIEDGPEGMKAADWLF